ncbi:DNA-directed RNA polymerase III subunit Rpc5 [Kipferlia bialata]|uniref:DNA-directed RNA polymerase III subunit Rpc5 n=1 Tax=Kipferlia bialata TaxID=797122 RepID=A0A391NNR0_9EUKA|nr:DNA-directed RNA polymerase III subunit Rpc5 [Kipferlia bialata]|eukprot:g733.t1
MEVDQTETAPPRACPPGEFDDDPVEEEIDVYLSQAFGDNLSVFQYPLRPTWRRYPLQSISNIQMFPRTQEVSLECPTGLTPANEDPEATHRPPFLYLEGTSSRLRCVVSRY